MQSFYNYVLVLVLVAVSQLTKGATLKGTVMDENNAPMIGATVIVSNTDFHAVAGLDGSYVIKNLPIGNYKVVASYVGYTPKNSSFTVSSAEETVTLHFHFVIDDVVVGSGIVVYGDMIVGSESAARKSEQEASSVINIISAKSMELSPDITVANVMQRVSGVSIVRNSNGDPQHAIVRGMDKRYNYTLVNGMKIPSPDNKNRYVPLDIFPASLLEKLEVTKALTPNMEGDAIGGVVNMVMKSAPEKKTISGDFQTGYNQINLDRKFQSFDHKATDYQTVWEKYGPNYQAQFSDFSKQNLVIKEIQPMPDVLANLSFGNRYMKKKLGVLLAAGYQNSYRGNNSIWFQTSTDFFGTNSPSLDELHERTYSTQQTRIAGHVRLDYRFNSNNSIKFYSGNYRLRNLQVRDDFASQLDARFYSAEKGNAIVTLKTRTRTEDQNIFTTSFQGEHKLKKTVILDWSLVRSAATNQEPDIAQFERNTGLKNFELQPITIERHMPRTWQHNADRDYTGYLNLTLKPAFLGPKGEFAVGGMYRRKNRDNFYNTYSFDPSPTTQTYGRDWETYADINQVLLNPLGSTADPQNYLAHEYLFDYYAQVKFMVLPKTQLLGGARMEHTNQGYELLYNTDPELQNSLSQKYYDILPSIHVKHMPNDKMNIRASFFKSITRPGYFEIVPYYNSNQADGYPEVGNPTLKRVQAYNFDTRWEYFPSTVNRIMLGAFYKKIIDPIEYATVLGSTNSPEVQPGNYGTAYNWGIESDFTRYFNKIGIKVNYTYTSSKITTTKALRQREDPNDPTSSVIVLTPQQTRPLQGQAKHLGNLSLLYKDMKAGTDAQLAVVYTGERIENASPFYGNDSWVRPFVQLDFSFEQKLNKHFTLTLKGQNLLNSPYEVIIKRQHMLPDKEYKLQESSDYTLIKKDYYGQSYRIGVRFNFL